MPISRRWQNASAPPWDLAAPVRSPSLASSWAGSGHTTSATRELRTTMSMSRSSRAAAGLFRRLAVTPGARLGAASPAAWSQVRARVRSFKRATRSDDDAVPTQNALPTPQPAGRALGHGGPPRRHLRRPRGRQPRIRRGSRPYHRGRGPQAPRQVTHPPRTTHRVTYPLDAATAFYKCRPIFARPPRASTDVSPYDRCF